MSDAAPKIVIAGTGSACWLAALTFARIARSPRDVTVVETPTDASEPEAEGTLPGLRTLHRLLRLDERDLMRQSRATFKLGTEFCDAPEAASRFFHAYGDVGAALESVAFHHHWLRVRGDEQSVSDYCLAAVAATLSLCLFRIHALPFLRWTMGCISTRARMRITCANKHCARESRGSLRAG
jgi:tryptophan halogenase